ncbi:MAG: uroporphyrinogen decarboxylase family protein [Kiritimatiellales bacterium]
MSRQIVLDLLNRKPVSRPPVMPITMMLAADFAEIPYGEYARDYKKLAEGQIRTAEFFGFDFVSGISDPAREAADFGAAIHFFDNQPPAIDENNALLKDPATLATLKCPDPLGGGRMSDRVNAIALMKERAGNDFAVEGWVEGPCAEGADLRGINHLMMDFFDDENFVRDLFTIVTDNAIAFAEAQIDAGADIIGVGDAAASLINPDLFAEFVLPEEKRLCDAIHSAGAFVRLHICGNISGSLKHIKTAGFDIVDIDYLVDLAGAREITGEKQILLGNIDPVSIVKNSTPEKIKIALADCRNAAGENYIIGAGCEIPRGTAYENVKAFREFADAI